MKPSSLKQYKVYFTWKDDRGIEHSGHSYYGAMSARRAVAMCKSEAKAFRPYKIYNVKAKLMK